MPIAHSAAYCPRFDTVFESDLYWMTQKFRGIHNIVLWGEGGALNQLVATAKLYLVAHSHDEQSKFEVDKTRWTADEMAALLESDRLPKNHRDIELLVCDAGLSTVTEALVGRFRRISAKHRAAAARGDTAAMASLDAQYKALFDKRWEGVAEYKYNWQMLPLAAQFVWAMHERGYRDLTVTCYKAEVSAYFTLGEVCLNLDRPGGKYRTYARLHPDLKVLWRATTTEEPRS
jgi:hypothetical protein